MNIKQKFTSIDSLFNKIILKSFIARMLSVSVNKKLNSKTLSLVLSAFLCTTLVSTHAHSTQMRCEEILNQGLYKDYSTELFPFPLAKSDNEAHVYPLKSVNDVKHNKSDKKDQQNTQNVTSKELLALKEFLSSQGFLKDLSKPFKKLYVHFKVNGHSLKRILTAVENHQLDINSISYRDLVKKSIAHTEDLKKQNPEQDAGFKRQIYVSFETEFGTLTTQENHPVNVFQIEKDDPVLKSLKQVHPKYANKNPNKIVLEIDEDHGFYQISLHTGPESTLSFETLELTHFISNVIIPILVEEEQRDDDFQPKN